MLFDRSGTGTEVEIGNLPSFSPSNQRLAAVQFTQSGYGGLENIVIWQVADQGLKELHRLPEQSALSWVQDGYTDFAIESWQGEVCLNIFAYADADLAAVDWDRAKAKRTPFHAAETDTWDIKRGRCP
jgi:hypothetical protein